MTTKQPEITGPKINPEGLMTTKQPEITGPKTNPEEVDCAGKRRPPRSEPARRAPAERSRRRGAARLCIQRPVRAGPARRPSSGSRGRGPGEQFSGRQRSHLSGGQRTGRHTRRHTTADGGASSETKLVDANIKSTLAKASDDSAAGQPLHQARDTRLLEQSQPPAGSWHPRARPRR